MDCRASVIIPVYNAEKTLRRCVESLVLGQERNLEVILSEDCSRDSSWALCQELAAEFPNVRCIQNERNSGVSHTRNRALELARGEYILFVDSDDWVGARYGAQLLKYARENRDSLCICGQHFLDKVHGSRRDYVWDAHAGETVRLRREQIYELSERFLLQQLWNKVFRRDIIEEYHIRFDENMSMGEDFQFVLDYMEAAGIESCTVLNEPLYYYIRWGNTSLMSKFGLIQNQQEYDRIEQLHRLSGLPTTEKRDAMLRASRSNYVYHLSRNPNLSKAEKLQAIERIMQDGASTQHYRKQLLQQAKEKIARMLSDAKNLLPRFRARMGRKKLQRLIRRQRQMLTASDFSIISQNCIGGVLYHDMGMQFLSPTINTFIREPDFVKLCCDPEYYMNLPLQMHWEEEYPVGRLDDVEIHFMHYETCKEARESWERRKKRINYDKILVLATDRDGFDGQVYEQWKKVPYPKVLFTANPEFKEDAIFFPEYEKAGAVGDLISQRLFYRDNTLLRKLNSL